MKQYRLKVLRRKLSNTTVNNVLRSANIIRCCSEYGTTIAVDLPGDNYLLIKVDPDYPEKPKVVIAMTENYTIEQKMATFEQSGYLS